MTVTDILAIDLATVCGFARGKMGGAPTCGSIRFGTREASDNAVFAHCLSWIAEVLEPRPRPDILVLEAMLPPGAKLGHTSREVRDRLAGLHGIIRGVAHLRGVFDIQEADVGDVRKHFIGRRNLKRERAKRAVVERCCMLGWETIDHNGADALALWHYCCARIKPELALQVSPLFQRGVHRTMGAHQ
jgi:hypothetical protein